MNPPSNWQSFALIIQRLCKFPQNMSGNKQFAGRALLSSGWKSFVSREGGRVRENFWGRVMKCLIKLFLQLNLFIL